MKKKMYVVYSDEYPTGIVFDHKQDAMDFSLDCRESGERAYVRVGYFTEAQLLDMQEI